MAWPKGVPRKPRVTVTEQEESVGTTGEVPTVARYTVEQLREIAAAGMSITEAKALLEDGYQPSDVLDIARVKAQQTIQAAADAQTATAKAMQKAMRPENETHPGISAFSRPEGDLAKPKPPLPFECFIDSYPCHKWPETEHWREWELMAQLTPGEFTVMRKDGMRMKVTVKGERDMDGKLSKVVVELPRDRDERKQVPPKMVLLQQLVRHTEEPRKVFLEATNEYLQLMFGSAA